MSLFTFKAICYYDSYLHKGIAIGFPWGCGGIVKNSPWECGAIGGRGLFAQRDCHWITLRLRRDCQRVALGMLSDWRIAVGLPLDCLWIFGLDRIAFWIAFGFALGLAEDGDCQGVAYGLPMEYFGIMQGFPWDFLGIAKNLPGCVLGIDKGLP